MGASAPFGGQFLPYHENTVHSDMMLNLIRCRFSTKSSAGLHDEEDLSNPGSRKLKADRASVVDLFKAELLWKQGFRGELVKMGVFDTGIRLDHPHVKNIRYPSLLTYTSCSSRPCPQITFPLLAEPNNILVTDHSMTPHHTPSPLSLD